MSVSAVPASLRDPSPYYLASHYKLHVIYIYLIFTLGKDMFRSLHERMHDDALVRIFYWYYVSCR